MIRRSPVAGPIAILVMVVAGCGAKIGKSCTQNVDCSPLGDRFCDVSAPGGYCTIEGCDDTSCPSESVCVRFLEPDPSRTCDVYTQATDCGASDVCLCDCGAPDAQGVCPVSFEVGALDSDGGIDADGGVSFACQAPPAQSSIKEAHGGHCAAKASEHRWCMLRCSNDGDCRSPGYSCESTGTFGTLPVAYIVPDSGISSGDNTNFCVKHPCAAGQTQCGSACVDTSSDRTNCGSCGTVCLSNQSCKSGVCG